MADNFINHHESCIQYACQEHSHKLVTVFLINGVKLSGQLTGRLVDGILLTRRNVTQTIFNHAIATVMPLVEMPEEGNSMDYSNPHRIGHSRHLNRG